ncbi:MAG: hypothetical protein IT434_04605 [Phycisphaerales bacterium]|jgi:hypothetical protein|nr:hypothetical protein [Phycisphaerales bacterium]
MWKIAISSAVAKSRRQRVPFSQMNVAATKEQFLRDTRVFGVNDAPERALRESFNAAVRTRKAPVYREDAPPAARARFADDFKACVRREAYSFRNVASESHLVSAIERLSSALTERHQGMLFGERLRIGITQKALNLYLKFMWCLDPAWPTPVHCPLDRIVLDKARVTGVWTQLDCIDTYRDWIGKVASCAKQYGFASMAEWELKAWQDHRNQNNSAERSC